MVNRRVIKGVLTNFLGTYTSRYSDYHGYWLFGFLVDHFEELEVDLLSEPTPSDGTAFGTARSVAATKFRDQVQKAKLEFSYLRKAKLTITRLSVNSRLTLGTTGSLRSGYDVRFFAVAELHNGRRYFSERVEFIAPHDPSFELRSSRDV